MTTDSPEFGREVQLTTRVNGRDWSGPVRAGATLLEFLRLQLGLTGTKRSCESQVCGACTVLVDRRPVSSCSRLAFEIEGKDVTTVEGLGDLSALGDLQRAFVESGAVQCGYCTPGQIVSAEGLLDEHPEPDLGTVRHWMAGNICRCGCYPAIYRAIMAVAKQRRSH